MNNDFAVCGGSIERFFPFWERLSADERELVCRTTTERRVGAGTNIHNAGDDCLGVALIRSGSLRVYMLSRDGREITLYRLGAGDICILTASCVIDAITFDVIIDAEEDSELLIVSSGVFNRLCETNIYVQAFAYKLATERFSDVMWAMQQILFMSFDCRLAIFLCDEQAKNGGDEIHMTHEQIAKYVGSAREVVSRMLKYFANEGYIAMSRGGVKVLDRRALSEIAAGSAQM